MHIVLVLPTYNEHDNLVKLLPTLDEVFATIPHQMSLLVVDDNSPDNSAQVVHDYMQKHKHVHLLTGNKQGLGAAYIRGMTYALEHLRADVLISMDADFSHDPYDLPRLIKCLDEGYDFIIGSRYTPGGSIPDNWSFMRRMNSKWGNIFARYIGGMYRVKDCTAGFRVIRASFVRKIDLHGLKVKGYTFLISLLNQCMKAGARVKEVPVHFVDRIYGETKLGLRDIVEFMFNVWWIRWNNSQTFLRFAMVGFWGLLVNLLCFWVLWRLGVNVYIASLLAVLLSIISNYYFNWKYTLKRGAIKNVGWFRRYILNPSAIAILVVSFGTFTMLTLFMPEENPLWFQLTAVLPATIINYLFGYRFNRR